MKTFFRALGLSIPAVFAATSAFAAGTGMPWEAPIDLVVGSISGPVLKGAMVLLIIAAGIAMATSSREGVQKFATLIFGGAIAGATLMFLGVFNIGNGAIL